MHDLIVQISFGVIAFSAGIIVLFFQAKFKEIDRKINKLFAIQDELKRIEIRQVKHEVMLNTLGQHICNGKWRYKGETE